jgi:predicted dehydrogenase
MGGDGAATVAARLEEGQPALTAQVGDDLIRVGVVGLGSFGRHHARHYAADERARLAAVADIDVGRARRAAADFGGAAFADHRALIGAVDAVSVVVPASSHAGIARDFIDAGVHVLVEKPIATDSAQARDLLARADEADVILQVGHVERFSPVVREMRSRVADPRRIASVRRAPWSGRSADVDVVLDLMIHDIDHILAFAGAPVATVVASGASVRTGVTDEAEAWLTFVNGVVATLSASRVALAAERRLIVTEPGTVLAADLAAATLSITSRGSAVVDEVAFDSHDNLAAEIAAFLDSVRAGHRPEVDGAAGLAALAVAERIQASIAESASSAKRRVKA